MRLKDLITKYKVNTNVVSIETLKFGMSVEKEHHKGPETTFRIVLDHLREFPDYYSRLKRMESSADKYWSKRKKPSIIKKKK